MRSSRPASVARRAETTYDAEAPDAVVAMYGMRCEER